MQPTNPSLIPYPNYHHSAHVTSAASGHVTALHRASQRSNSGGGGGDGGDECDVMWTGNEHWIVLMEEENESGGEEDGWWYRFGGEATDGGTKRSLGNNSILALSDSPTVPYTIRTLAIEALTALVARRDATTGALTHLARQTNVLQELGVGKGQYLGLLPTLIRYSLAALNSFLLHDGTKKEVVTNCFPQGYETPSVASKPA